MNNVITKYYKTEKKKFDTDMSDLELYKYFQNYSNPHPQYGVDVQSNDNLEMLVAGLASPGLIFE